MIMMNIINIVLHENDDYDENHQDYIMKMMMIKMKIINFML